MIPFLLDITKKSRRGPLMGRVEFTSKIYERCNELAKSHDITYDPNDMIPQDLSMADDLYEAGMELLTDVGIYNQDTSRIIKLERENVESVIRNMNLTLAHYKSRKEGGDNAPMTLSSPCCLQVSEEAYIPLHLSHAKEPIDGIGWGVLMTLFGEPIKVGTPQEIYACAYRRKLAERVLLMAGRLGMGLGGSSQAISGLARTLYTSAWNHLISPLTVNWQILNLQMLHELKGKPSGSGYMTILYGYGGNEEGSAVLGMAGRIAVAATTYKLRVIGSQPVESSGITSSKGTIWLEAALDLAATRKWKCATYNDMYFEAGPCTEMLLYEIATRMVSLQPVGIDRWCGPQPSRGGRTDYSSGLEARFACDLRDCLPGMRLADGNELARAIYKKYEGKLKNPPNGKRFQDCYNIKTIEPTKEYLDIYRKVKKELADLGVPFKD